MHETGCFDRLPSCLMELCWSAWSSKTCLRFSKNSDESLCVCVCVCVCVRFTFILVFYGFSVSQLGDALLLNAVLYNVFWYSNMGESSSLSPSNIQHLALLSAVQNRAQVISLAGVILIGFQENTHTHIHMVIPVCNIIYSIISWWVQSPSHRSLTLSVCWFLCQLILGYITISPYRQVSPTGSYLGNASGQLFLANKIRLPSKWMGRDS